MKQGESTALTINLCSNWAKYKNKESDLHFHRDSSSQNRVTINYAMTAILKCHDCDIMFANGQVCNFKGTSTVFDVSLSFQRNITVQGQNLQFPSI
jgi:hypothetical protein